ncbi:MAG: cyclic nucleotide-binding domain-containing protein [Candidatus Nanopelagicales bacterium]
MEVKLIDEVLAGHRFFAPLPQEFRGRLAGCSRLIEFEEGEHLVSAGSAANSFFAIRSGRVAIGIQTPNRGLAVIETLHAGDIVGWSWLFPPFRWHFDAVAVRPVRAVELNAQCIRSYLDENPQAGFELVCGLASVMEERLESARMRLIDLYGDADVSSD